MFANPFEQISALLVKVPGDVSLSTQQQILDLIGSDSFEGEVVRELGIVSVHARNRHYTYGFKRAIRYPVTQVSGIKLVLSFEKKVTFNLAKTESSISLTDYHGLGVGTNLPMISGELIEVTFRNRPNGATLVESRLGKRILGKRIPGPLLSVVLDERGQVDVKTLKIG